MVSVSSGNSLISKYLSFFTYRGESLIRRSGSSWREVSRFHSLSDSEIEDSLQLTSKLHRAVCLDSKSRFLIIHIPASGSCRNAESLKRVLSLLRELGLTAATYQIEEDWYLYVFFSQPVKLNQYAELLSKYLSSCGLELGPETLSVLKQSMHAPLPLQSGFSWITGDGYVVQFRTTLSTQDALQRWLSEADALSIEPEVFEARCLDVKNEVQQSTEYLTGHTEPSVQSDLGVTTVEPGDTSDSGLELDFSPESSDCPDSSSAPLSERVVLSAESESSQVIPVIEEMLPAVQSGMAEELELQIEEYPEQLPLFPQFPVPKQSAIVQDDLEPEIENEAPIKQRQADAFPQLSLFPDLVPGAQVFEQPQELPKTIPKRSNKARRAPPDTG